MSDDHKTADHVLLKLGMKVWRYLRVTDGKPVFRHGSLESVEIESLSDTFCYGFMAKSVGFGPYNLDSREWFSSPETAIIGALTDVRLELENAGQTIAFAPLEIVWLNHEMDKVRGK